MYALLTLLVVLGCCLLVGIMYYRAHHRPVVFQDIVADPVFERLVWQGYGDGDWWHGALFVDGATVAFLIGGSNAPDPRLVACAHSLAATYTSFHQALVQFLFEQAHRRSAEAAIIEQLVLKSIALFPGSVEQDPEAYQGEFVLLQRRDQQSPKLLLREEWRCDFQDGQFTNLRLWA